MLNVIWGDLKLRGLIQTKIKDTLMVMQNKKKTGRTSSGKN